MTAPEAFIVAAFVFFIAGLVIGAHGERNRRRDIGEEVRAQLAAFATNVRISEAAWEARQQLHQAAAEARLQPPPAPGC